MESSALHNSVFGFWVLGFKQGAFYHEEGKI
jgi:hypothetical protein